MMIFRDYRLLLMVFSLLISTVNAEIVCVIGLQKADRSKLVAVLEKALSEKENLSIKVIEHKTKPITSNDQEDKLDKIFELYDEIATKKKALEDKENSKINVVLSSLNVRWTDGTHELLCTNKYRGKAAENKWWLITLYSREYPGLDQMNRSEVYSSHIPSMTFPIQALDRKTDKDSKGVEKLIAFIASFRSV